MSDLKVPILAIIIGEGGSGGALALALGDEVWMMEHSIYAILSPEGFASILWKDGSRAKEAAGLMKITAKELHELQVIERVIPETKDGEFLSKEVIIADMQQEIIRKIAELSQKSTNQLLAERYQRFRKF
jgi:acetyl-CoA carboxylase carboxyl transferase subunit alpha